jgi:copper chaperone
METFKLPDMTCGGCARKVTQALQRVDPACQVQVDLPAQQVQVQSQQPREPLAQALREAGFEPA